MAEQKKPERKQSAGAAKSSTTKGDGAKKRSAAQIQDEHGKRKTLTAVESIGFLLIVALGLVLVNVASTFVFGRLDLTENKVHSLSQGSERLVGGLEDRMEIVAYFTEDLPEPFNATEQYVRHLLSEYEAASGGKLHVRFVNPDSSDEREQAEQDGVREVPHQVIGNDSVNVRNGYRGMVIRYLGEREVIPVISQTRGLEYEITQAIRRLVREPMPVGIASGHGSPEPTKGLGSLRAALPQYELRAVDVNQEIDDELKALLIVSPTERFSDTELRRINQYVMNGGSLGVFGGSTNLDISGFAPTARAVDTGLNELLRPWGMRMESTLIADWRCGRVPMRTPIGIPIPVSYPPAPIVVFDDDQQEHPAIFRLTQAPMFFASPIRTTDAFARLNGRALGRSSEQSWLLTGDTISLEPRDPRQWEFSGGSTGPFNMIAAVEGQLPSAFAGASGGEGANIEAPERATRSVRVFVAGTGSLLRDEFMPPPEQQQGQMTGGIALALNSIDWLTQDQDLIAIRAKNIEDPAIDVPQSVSRAQEAAQENFERIRAGEIENEEQAEQAEREVEEAVRRYNEAVEAWDSRKDMIRWGITLGIPFLVIVAGVVRWILRRNRRQSLDQLRAQLVKQRQAESKKRAA
jgi:gliding-associated putative ABC transporter substrate-binding component GldG